MPHLIRIRDVVHASTYVLGPEPRVLRVPYDMFRPAGPVTREGPHVHWFEGDAAQSARCSEAVLGDCHPGERVLVSLSGRPGGDEWWLCEVEAVDGAMGSGRA